MKNANAKILLIGLFLIPLVVAIPEDLNINGKLTDSDGILRISAQHREEAYCGLILTAM